eukprot:6186477-Pleurochrysis_carterae.AAC.1
MPWVEPAAWAWLRAAVTCARDVLRRLWLLRIQAQLLRSRDSELQRMQDKLLREVEGREAARTARQRQARRVSLLATPTSDQSVPFPVNNPVPQNALKSQQALQSRRRTSFALQRACPRLCDEHARGQPAPRAKTMLASLPARVALCVCVFARVAQVFEEVLHRAPRPQSAADAKQLELIGAYEAQVAASAPRSALAGTVRNERLARRSSAPSRGGTAWRCAASRRNARGRHHTNVSDGVLFLTS